MKTCLPSEIELPALGKPWKAGLEILEGKKYSLKFVAFTVTNGVAWRPVGNTDK